MKLDVTKTMANATEAMSEGAFQHCQLSGEQGKNPEIRIRRRRWYR